MLQDGPGLILLHTLRHHVQDVMLQRHSEYVSCTASAPRNLVSIAVDSMAGLEGSLCMLRNICKPFLLYREPAHHDSGA